MTKTIKVTTDQNLFILIPALVSMRDDLRRKIEKMKAKPDKRKTPASISYDISDAEKKLADVIDLLTQLGNYD